MKDKTSQLVSMMLMDLVNENLLTKEEAELARRYYMKSEKGLTKEGTAVDNDKAA